jgi:hypothetical protein
MPYFYTEAEVDVEIDEFLSACSPKEIKNLIDILREDGHLTNIISPIPKDKMTIMDEEWMNIIDKLSTLRLRMTSEEESIIKNIVKNY